MSSGRSTESVLRLGDLVAVASLGLRTRRMRAALSELGIAIGVASVVGILGISSASEANLLAQIGALSNLLQVVPGPSFGSGSSNELPLQAPAMISRISAVQGVTTSAKLPNLTVRRSDYVDPKVTLGLNVEAVQTNLLQILGGTVRTGTFLNDATAHFPAVVMGSSASSRMGIDQVGERVWIGSNWFTVVGILNQFPADSDLDQSVMMGYPVAATMYNYDGSPTTIFVRTDPDQTNQVSNVLAATTDPEAPEQVQVNQPSDALQVRAAAKSSLNNLVLGIGAVALLVGGVGIANVMLIAVLERRSEIGLRRALGATKGHIAAQFLAESILLSGLGGSIGVVIGVILTLGYSQLNAVPFALPPLAVVGGLGAALLTGAVAGLYPATRAAGLAPTDALGST